MKMLSAAAAPIRSHATEKPAATDWMMPVLRLSADLTALRQQINGRSLTVKELEQALKGRGFAMLLLLLTLPFCFVPLPGLSTPFGLAVFLIGIRLAVGRKPWLPGFILQKRLSLARLARVLNGSICVVRGLEKIARPRMHFLQRWPGMPNLIGFSVASGGLLLLLPLPIPFSNTIPAWAVVLLSAGMIERDGLLVLAGNIMTLASWVFIAACWLLGAKAVPHFFDAVTGAF
jgi:hypothetical protein